jgi:hypothetical protein
VQKLVEQLARQNPALGYRRIQGESRIPRTRPARGPLGFEMNDGDRHIGPFGLPNGGGGGFGLARGLEDGPSGGPQGSAGLGHAVMRIPDGYADSEGSSAAMSARVRDPQGIRSWYGSKDEC